MATDVIVVRAFSIGGVRQEPGSRVSVGDGLAAELISAGKAERAQPQEPDPTADIAPPATVQSEPKAAPRAEPGPERPRPAPTPSQRPRKP
jgi:hypothetical protein